MSYGVPDFFWRLIDNERRIAFTSGVSTVVTRNPLTLPPRAYVAACVRLFIKPLPNRAVENSRRNQVTIIAWLHVNADFNVLVKLYQH